MCDEWWRRLICSSCIVTQSDWRPTDVYLVDHGLLRKGEGDMVMEQFGEGFNMNIIRVDAQERFMSKLQGVSDPEQNVKSLVMNSSMYLMMKHLN